jgi:tetratricopeptide (TPR) repeat protein
VIAFAEEWYMWGRVDELRTALEEIAGRELPAALRAEVLGALADAIGAQGDATRAVRLAREGVALARALEDDERLATALNKLGGALLGAGDLEGADGCWAELRDLARKDLAVWRGPALNNLGYSATLRGDFKTAVPALEEALALGMSPPAAHNLGVIAFARGRKADALRFFAEGARSAHDLRWAAMIVASLEGIAAAAASRDAGTAALVLGAVDRERARLGLDERSALEREVREHADSTLRAVLGGEAYAATGRAGAELELDQAVAIALTLATAPAPRPAPTLSRRL